MTSVQTAPGLPASMPSHRSRFIVSASSLRVHHSTPSSTSVSSPSSTGSDQGSLSRRKRFSPVSVTHTHVLGRAAHGTKVVSLGTVDLAAVLRHAAATRTAPELARTRTPELDEPEPTPAPKDTREKPRYRVPTSPVRPTKPLHGTNLSRPTPICLVRPRAQFPLYLPILDSRVPPIVLPSLESLDAAAAQTYITPSNSNSGTEGRRSGRTRRPASRTLEYTSDPIVPPVRKRRADATLEKRELRTSKRARKDVNYVIPSLASIEREIANAETGAIAPRPRRVRRRSETSVSPFEQGASSGNGNGDVEMKDKEDSPLSAEDEVRTGRKARGGKPAN
ncbi:unnamed protein product [Rhizoctonia solani]|uniref:Uncharacterized protein n=1 Tax=Rhizoctonia solani TaxID=456999 RepID=A0A8H7LGQ1_9AGAM|nr:hypothetical protein RHS04_05590 [Rhizoctonia solani]CAE6477992.1 unnamed protein product [Rhizoctonia solani]